MSEALRALRSGIMRLLAPDVRGSISVSAEDIAPCDGDDFGNRHGLVKQITGTEHRYTPQCKRNLV